VTSQANAVRALSKTPGSPRGPRGRAGDGRDAGLLRDEGWFMTALLSERKVTSPGSPPTRVKIASRPAQSRVKSASEAFHAGERLSDF
jgi:hypothetical protein